MSTNHADSRVICMTGSRGRPGLLSARRGERSEPVIPARASVAGDPGSPRSGAIRALEARAQPDQLSVDSVSRIASSDLPRFARRRHQTTVVGKSIGSKYPLFLQPKWMISPPASSNLRAMASWQVKKKTWRWRATCFTSLKARSKRCGSQFTKTSSKNSGRRSLSASR